MDRRMLEVTYPLHCLRLFAGPSGQKVVVRYVGYTSYKYTAYHVKNSITGMESILLCLKQEAQLSQRDRATLRVIKYFAKSLKVTEGHSK